MTSALRYLEHLSDGDLRFLVEAAAIGGDRPERMVDFLRHEPEAIEPLLGHPAVFERIFREDGPAGGYMSVSPLIPFAVLIHRVHGELKKLRFVPEWTAPRQRLPVFEVEGMRGFLDSSDRRFYLAALLASFTRVVSGSIWIQTQRGPRRKRFNELDPVQLASLVEIVRGADRGMIYRRLGDLSLFLAGIFPDYVGRRMLRNLELERLARAAGMKREEISPLREAGRAGGPFGAITVLEELGRRWYRLALQSLGGEALGASSPHPADPFPEGRRVLNFLSDRYIRRLRGRWFPEPAA